MATTAVTWILNVESVVSINPQSTLDKDLSGDKLAPQAHIQ